MGLVAGPELFIQAIYSVLESSISALIFTLYYNIEFVTGMSLRVILHLSALF